MEAGFGIKSKKLLSDNGNDECDLLNFLRLLAHAFWLCVVWCHPFLMLTKKELSHYSRLHPFGTSLFRRTEQGQPYYSSVFLLKSFVATSRLSSSSSLLAHEFLKLFCH